MIILVPFGQDQFKVARRVEVGDVGTRLPAGRLRPDRLRAAVREVMTKRALAERIASVFAATGGPKAAVEALEELLGGPISGPPSEPDTLQGRSRRQVEVWLGEVAP